MDDHRGAETATTATPKRGRPKKAAEGCVDTAAVWMYRFKLSCPSLHTVHAMLRWNGEMELPSTECSFAQLRKELAELGIALDGVLRRPNTDDWEAVP